MAKLPTIAEVRKMSAEDLRAEVATIRRQAAEVRLGVELSKEKDTSKMKKLRKHLAQLLTVLQEKTGTERIQRIQKIQKNGSSESFESSESSKNLCPRRLKSLKSLNHENQTRRHHFGQVLKTVTVTVHRNVFHQLYKSVSAAGRRSLRIPEQ